MKHTPGPWKQTRCNDDLLIQEVADTTGWKKDYPFCYIAMIGGWGYSGNGNANLIMAAPELLQYLIVAHDWITELRADVSADVLYEIEKTIAKARGEL